ncbi:hypothetical protein L1887_23213 [Cichorium endivia]|nr:hypothetical protein L1887_23213 [Cichorium endivia]
MTFGCLARLEIFPFSFLLNRYHAINPHPFDSRIDNAEIREEYNRFSSCGIPSITADVHGVKLHLPSRSSLYTHDHTWERTEENEDDTTRTTVSGWKIRTGIVVAGREGTNGAAGRRCGRDDVTARKKEARSMSTRKSCGAS